MQETLVKNCWRYKILSPTFSAAKNTVLRGLENVDALECQLSQPEVAAHTWLLDDEPVHTSEKVEVVYFENGLRHLLLLKNLKPQDSCRVTFLAGDVVTSAFLTVRGAKLREGPVAGGSNVVLLRFQGQANQWLEATIKVLWNQEPSGA